MDRSSVTDSFTSSLFECQGLFGFGSGFFCCWFFLQDFPSWPDVLQNTDEEVDASEVTITRPCFANRSDNVSPPQSSRLRGRVRVRDGVHLSGVRLSCFNDVH